MAVFQHDDHIVRGEAITHECKKRYELQDQDLLHTTALMHKRFNNNEGVSIKRPPGKAPDNPEE